MTQFQSLEAAQADLEAVGRSWAVGNPADYGLTEGYQDVGHFQTFWSEHRGPELVRAVLRKYDLDTDTYFDDAMAIAVEAGWRALNSAPHPVEHLTDHQQGAPSLRKGRSE